MVPDAASRLTSTLMTLKGATSVSSIRQQVVDDVVSLAGNHQPSRSTVGKFADGLTNALAGRIFRLPLYRRFRSLLWMPCIGPR